MNLNGSMADWSDAERRRAWLAGTAWVLVTALPVGLRIGQVWTQPDTEHYLRMAAGEPAMLPFASRQLGPLLVRGLIWLLPVSIHTGFLLLAVASLVFFAGTVFYLLVRSAAPQLLLPAIAGLFFWTVQVNGLVLPDLLYAALLCSLLLLLDQRHFTAAVIMFLPLALARESTVLVLLCFLVAGRKHLRQYQAILATLATGCGLLSASYLASHAINREHLSPGVYLLAKMPWNFLKNVSGLSVWANVNQPCADPRWQIPVHLGPLHAVGFCGFVPEAPIGMLACALASFGLLPLLLVRSAVLERFGKQDISTRFCVLYGAASFLLAPLLGATFLRLFGYGWPLFLAALPRLLGSGRGGFRSRRAAAAFVVLHLAISWWASSFYRAPLVPLGNLVLIASASLLGWFLLLWTWKPMGAANREVMGI